VSAEHDKKFFDTFMMVLGVLVAVAIGILILVRIVAANTQEKHVMADPALRAAVEERIQPIGKVAIAGQDNSALAMTSGAQAGAASGASGAASAAPAADMSGEQVYNMACVACHGAGVAGAPKHGDKGAWSARLAKGIDTLYKHAIEGFQGDAGFMPPKGGRVDLSDQSVKNAVDFMVQAAK